MISNKVKERFAEIERLAKAAGLDPYDVQFFEVPADLIYQVASYGLPTRYSHWSFGKSYAYQRTQGEMGFSKIYELILNNDPSYAFLDESNTDTINLLICAHCLGHSHFFKNNVMFRINGETNMISVAKRHAEIIDQFRSDYGDDEVDEWLDTALALERHIDVYKGLSRQRYPTRHVQYEERTPKPYEDVVERKPSPLVKKVIKAIHIPPQIEKDVLWFLAEYGNLEPWQKKIFEIVRRESYYFFPQYRTKTINEGFASYWHAELMRQYSYGSDNDYGVEIRYPLTAAEHLDFAASHEKVVQPGLKFPLKISLPEVDSSGKPTGRTIKKWNPRLKDDPRLFSAATRLNPYYVGFIMLRDIKKRWDEYYQQGYRLDEYDNKIPVTIDGNQKLLEVARDEDDVSFYRNYLTEELAEELHLFAYGNVDEYEDSYETQEQIAKRLKDSGEKHLGQLPIDQQYILNNTISVRTKELKSIINMMARVNNNYGVPYIVVRRVDEAGLLRLEHVEEDATNLDLKYAEHVLQYVGRVWGRPVELIRKDRKNKKTWTLTWDGLCFDVGHETEDYPECIENTSVPSSW